jgi:hypothetical protein
MPLAFGSLALVESPGLRTTTQAREGRLVEDPLEDLVPSSHPLVVAHPLAGVTGCRDKTCIGSEPISTLSKAQMSPTVTRNSAPRIGTIAGRLVRIRASGRAKKRFCSSLSMFSMRSFRARISLASSATMPEATSCAGRLTLWDLAALSALCATLSDPFTPRFLRKRAIRLWPARLRCAGLW